MDVFIDRGNPEGRYPQIFQIRYFFDNAPEVAAVISVRVGFVYIVVIVRIAVAEPVGDYEINNIVLRKYGTPPGWFDDSLTD
jgi:hypothetical protein